MSALPADARFGDRFQSVAMPLDAADADAGRTWLQAIRLSGGWTVLAVELKGAGSAAQREQRTVLRQAGLGDAVQHIRGWEQLHRQQGDRPVAGHDAAALGFRHIDLFLAREGLATDAAGRPHPVDAANDAVFAAGSFAEADIALAVQTALPAALAPAQPLEGPDSPLVSTRRIRGNGTIKDRADEDDYSRYEVDRSLKEGDTEFGRRFIGQHIASDRNKAIAAMAAAAGKSLNFTPADLGYFYVRALAARQAEVAGVARHLGASVTAFAAQPAQWYRDVVNDDTAALLALPQSTGAVELLLQEGLPAEHHLVWSVLLNAASKGATATVDLLAPLVPKPWLGDARLAGWAAQHPPVLQSLLRQGMPLAGMAYETGVGVLESICCQADDSALKVVLAEGIALPARAEKLLASAINADAGGCAARLVLAGALDAALAPKERRALLLRAGERAMDAACANMLALDPALAPVAAAEERFLNGAVAGTMPLTLQRLLRAEIDRTALARALLLQGDAAAMTAALAVPAMPFATALRALDAKAEARLFSPARAHAVRSLLEAGHSAAPLLLTRMAERNQDCAVTAAARMGDAALLRSVQAAGQRMAIVPIGRDTALHVLAREGSPELAPLLIAAVPPQILNLRNEQGRTAAMLAAQTGKAPLLAALRAAGADLDVQDRTGLTVRDYARMQGDAETLAALEPPPPPAPAPTRSRFGRLSLR